MGFFQKFPYTDEHQLNLDWILRLFKTLHGGTTGQVLKKRSNKDFDWEWGASGGGGTSDYNDLTNKPSINSVELSGNKTLSQLGINVPVQSVAGKTGAVTLDGDDIAYDSTDCYAIGTVGKAVSDLKIAIDDIEDALGYEEPSINLLNPIGFVEGYYSSGVWTESSSYLTSNYIDLGAAEKLYTHRFNLNNGQKQDTAAYFSYIYWFTEDKTYSDRTPFASGTTDTAIPSGAKFARVMGVKTTINNQFNDNKGLFVGIQDTNTWVAFSAGGFPDYEQEIADINSKIGLATVSLASNVYTIKTAKAQFAFQKRTKATENLDTWRLYSGGLNAGNDTLFTMWIDSDAEGTIKLSGETDYIGGYHGSEVATAFKVFIDGIDCTALTSIAEREFKTLDFYVESDVYHCYQDDPNATVAFKRNKIVSFTKDGFEVSNQFKAEEAVTVISARTSLFQCYKNDGNSNPVFTNYSVNSDFKCYAVADAIGSILLTSSKMTEATLETIYAKIHVRALIADTAGYMGSVVNFGAQNRMKFYFDSISASTALTIGDVIMGQFKVEII